MIPTLQHNASVFLLVMLYYSIRECDFLKWWVGWGILLRWSQVTNENARASVHIMSVCPISSFAEAAAAYIILYPRGSRRRSVDLRDAFDSVPLIFAQTMRGAVFDPKQRRATSKLRKTTHAWQSTKLPREACACITKGSPVTYVSWRHR